MRKARESQGYLCQLIIEGREKLILRCRQSPRYLQILPIKYCTFGTNAPVVGTPPRYTTRLGFL